MPDYYDISELRVIAEEAPVPAIEWQPLPNVHAESGSGHRLILRNYVNPPRGMTTFRVADGYTLPSGWRLPSNGNLTYRPILGETTRLKFTAIRDGETADSNAFQITRNDAFTLDLVPNERTPHALTFKGDNVCVFNSSEFGVNLIRNYITVFDRDGNEQLSESIEPAFLNDWGRSGCVYDGTHFWLCGLHRSDGRQLRKVNADGTANTNYSFSGGEIVALAFDGTYLYGLDINQYQLRKFNRSGVEQTPAVSLPRAGSSTDFTGFIFNTGYYGMTYANGHLYIPQNHIVAGDPWLFAITPSGTRVRSRDIQIESATWHTREGIVYDSQFSGCLGVAYDAANDNIWWMLNELDAQGDRYSLLKAKSL